MVAIARTIRITLASLGGSDSNAVPGLAEDVLNVIIHTEVDLPCP